MWRGQLGLGLRSFQLTLAATDTPNVDVTTERMTVRTWGWRPGLPACPHVCCIMDWECFKFLACFCFAD
jgi:hypothetical protein